jgi:hypothetical protein
MTVEGPMNKRKSSSVSLVQSKEKLLPTDAQKIFRAISECECSVCPTGLLTDVIHPCLLHLQPACVSLRLRPPRPWPPSCSTLPLCSPSQLRVPPYIARAPSPTRSALPSSPHSTSRRCQPVSPASPGPVRYVCCPPPPSVIRAHGYPTPGTFYVADAASVAAIALTQ